MDFYSTDRHISNRATAQELLDIQQGSVEDAIALLDDTPIFAQDDRDEIVAEIHRLAEQAQ